MIKYLIQVIQYSLTPAILAALMFGFACKDSGGRGKKYFAAGTLAGAACAFILAVLRRVTVRLINREYINIVILSAAVVAGILFIIFLWKTRREESSARSEKIFNFVSVLLPGLLFFYALPTIFLYPTEFVLPGESVFSTDFLFKLAGYASGLFAVFLIALALFKVASSLSAGLVRVLITIGITVNVVNEIATVAQFLLARRLVSLPRRIFRVVILTINYNDFFLYALMALTFLLPVFLYIKSLHPRESWANPAQHRKIRAAMRGRKRWSAGVIAGYVFAVLSLTALKAWNEREVVLSPAEPMTIRDGEIVIPIETVQDRRLHRYNYTASDATQMRFIIIRKSEAAYGVGLDACDICGPTGYYEREEQVICKLCDVVMNISTIGFKGGCNPVPLAYTLREGNLVIDTVNLENEKSRFRQ